VFVQVNDTSRQETDCIATICKLCLCFGMCHCSHVL